MKFIGLALVLLSTTRETAGKGERYYPPERDWWIDAHHVKLEELEKGLPSEVAPGYKVVNYLNKDSNRTPDFRLGDWRPFGTYEGGWNEYNRPYQLFLTNWEEKDKGSFKGKQLWKHKVQLGCYCTVVVRKFELLSTCAVITHRHVLTTASAIDDFLKENGWRDNLHNYLGVEYDRAFYGNSTRYVEISRIHFHPQYTHYRYNMSHPLWTNDLAILTLLHAVRSVVGEFVTEAYICPRADPEVDMKLLRHFWVVGFQFIKGYNRNPNKYSKFGVRMRTVAKCPIVQWGWYICLYDKANWAPYGLDSGAILHARYTNNKHGDGPVGIYSFTSDLRAGRKNHYFTVISSDENLEFFYDAYMGLLPYAWLDKRFYDTAMRAPVPKPWFHIPWTEIHNFCAWYNNDADRDKYCVPGKGK